MIVSVIVPFNKNRGWLSQCIASIENQVFDGEIELIISQSDKTVGFNINRGIERATGSLIKYVSEDDILPPDSIRHSVEAIGDHDFLHGNAINFYMDGSEELYIPAVTHPDLTTLLKQSLVHGGTMLYRRDVFDRFGMFDETLTSGEEYDLHLRMLKGGARLQYCNQILYRYRRHAMQKSLGINVDQTERATRIEMIRNRYR